MLKLTNEGYVCVSKNGIEYSLLEGKTINPHGKAYASDICFIMFFGNEDEPKSILIGWLWGAAFIGANDDTNETIEYLINSYEKEHLDFVEKYRKEN